MYLKIGLAVLAFSLVGCTTAPVTTTKTTTHQSKRVLEESYVRTLLDGTWIIRQTKYTPKSPKITGERYFEYYSALHAHTIGCKRFSKVKLKVRKYEQAYKCMAGGSYITENSLKLGSHYH